MLTNRKNLPVRLLIYFALISLVLTIECELIIKFGYCKIVRENTLIEWVQLFLVGISGIGFLGMGLLRNGPVLLWNILGGLALMACVRELDSTLESLFFEDVHNLILVAGGLVILSCIYQHRKTFLSQAKALCKRPSFLIMLIGLVIVTLWAQIFGQHDLWRALEIPQARRTKRIMEESLEFVGYFFIFFGMIEEFFQTKKRNILTTTSSHTKRDL